MECSDYHSQGPLSPALGDGRQCHHTALQHDCVVVAAPSYYNCSSAGHTQVSLTASHPLVRSKAGADLHVSDDNQNPAIVSSVSNCANSTVNAKNLSSSKLPAPTQVSTPPVAAKRTSLSRVLLRKGTKEKQQSDVVRFNTLPSARERVSVKHDYRDIGSSGTPSGDYPSNFRKSATADGGNGNSCGHSKFSKKKSLAGSGIFSSWLKKKSKDADSVFAETTATNSTHDPANISESDVTLVNSRASSDTAKGDPCNLDINLLKLPSSDKNPTPTEVLSPRIVSGVSWRFSEQPAETVLCGGETCSDTDNKSLLSGSKPAKNLDMPADTSQEIIIRTIPVTTDVTTIDTLFKDDFAFSSVDERDSSKVCQNPARELSSALVRSTVNCVSNISAFEDDLNDGIKMHIQSDLSSEERTNSEGDIYSSNVDMNLTGDTSTLSEEEFSSPCRGRSEVFGETNRPVADSWPVGSCLTLKDAVTVSDDHSLTQCDGRTVHAASGKNENFVELAASYVSDERTVHNMVYPFVDSRGLVGVNDLNRNTDLPWRRILKAPGVHSSFMGVVKNADSGSLRNEDCNENMKFSSHDSKFAKNFSENYCGNAGTSHNNLGAAVVSVHSEEEVFAVKSLPFNGLDIQPFDTSSSVVDSFRVNALKVAEQNNNASFGGATKYTGNEHFNETCAEHVLSPVQFVPPDPDSLDDKSSVTSREEDDVSAEAGRNFILGKSLSNAIGFQEIYSTSKVSYVKHKAELIYPSQSVLPIPASKQVSAGGVSNDLYIYCHNSQDGSTNCHNQDPGANCHSQDAGTNCHSQDAGTNCHSQDAGTNCHSQDAGTNCNSQDAGTNCHNQDPGTNCHSQGPGTNCHNQDAGTNCHSQDAGTNCHSQDAGTNCHSQDAGTNCHSQDAGTNCNNQDAGTNCHSQNGGTNCHSQDAGTNCHSQDAGTNCHSQDAGTNCHSQNGGTNCHSQDAGTNCHSQNGGTNCHSQDAGADCHSQDVGTNCHSQHADTSCHSQNADTNCHSQNADTNCHSQNADTNCHSQNADTNCHSQNADTNCHSQNADTNCHSQNADTNCHSQNADTNCHSQNVGINANTADMSPKTPVSRIPEALNYYQLTDKQTEPRDGYYPLMGAGDDFFDGACQVDFDPGEFDPAVVDSLLEYESLSGLVSPSDRMLLQDIKDNLVQWRKKHEWLSKKKRQKNWRKMGGGSLDAVVIHAGDGTCWALHVAGLLLHALQPRPLAGGGAPSCDTLPPRVECRNIEQVLGPNVPPVLADRIQTAKLQLVILSPAFLRHVNDPQFEFGRVIVPRRVVCLMLGVTTRHVHERHLMALFSFKEWPLLAVRPPYAWLCAAVLSVGLTVLCSSRLYRGCASEPPKGAFRICPPKLTEAQRCVHLFMEHDGGGEEEEEVWLEGVPSEEVVLEVLDHVRSPCRITDWRIRNPYCLSFRMPDDLLRDSCLVEVRLSVWGRALGAAMVRCESRRDTLAGLLHELHDGRAVMSQNLGVSSSALDGHLASLVRGSVPPTYVQPLIPALSPAVSERPSDEGVGEEGAASIRQCQSQFPTWLHFAAHHGLTELTSELLTVPGWREALRTPNSAGRSPDRVAHDRGHNALAERLEYLALAAIEESLMGFDAPPDLSELSDHRSTMGGLLSHGAFASGSPAPPFQSPRTSSVSSSQSIVSVEHRLAAEGHGAGVDIHKQQRNLGTSIQRNAGVYPYGVPRGASDSAPRGNTTLGQRQGSFDRRLGGVRYVLPARSQYGPSDQRGSEGGPSVPPLSRTSSMGSWRSAVTLAAAASQCTPIADMKSYKSETLRAVFPNDSTVITAIVSKGDGDGGCGGLVDVCTGELCDVDKFSSRKNDCVDSSKCDSSCASYGCHSSSLPPPYTGDYDLVSVPRPVPLQCLSVASVQSVMLAGSDFGKPVTVSSSDFCKLSSGAPTVKDNRGFKVNSLSEVSYHKQVITVNEDWNQCSSRGIEEKTLLEPHSSSTPSSSPLGNSKGQGVSAISNKSRFNVTVVTSMDQPRTTRNRSSSSKNNSKGAVFTGRSPDDTLPEIPSQVESPTATAGTANTAYNSSSSTLPATATKAYQASTITVAGGTSNDGTPRQASSTCHVLSHAVSSSNESSLAEADITWNNRPSHSTESPDASYLDMTRSDFSAINSSLSLLHPTLPLSDSSYLQTANQVRDVSLLNSTPGHQSTPPVYHDRIIESPSLVVSLNVTSFSNPSPAPATPTPSCLPFSVGERLNNAYSASQTSAAPAVYAPGPANTEPSPAITSTGVVLPEAAAAGSGAFSASTVNVVYSNGNNVVHTVDRGTTVESDIRDDSNAVTSSQQANEQQDTESSLHRGSQATESFGMAARIKGLFKARSRYRPTLHTVSRGGGGGGGGGGGTGDVLSQHLDLRNDYVRDPTAAVPRAAPVPVAGAADATRGRRDAVPSSTTYIPNSIHSVSNSNLAPARGVLEEEPNRVPFVPLAYTSSCDNSTSNSSAVLSSTSAALRQQGTNSDRLRDRALPLLPRADTLHVVPTHCTVAAPSSDASLKGDVNTVVRHHSAAGTSDVMRHFQRACSEPRPPQPFPRVNSSTTGEDLPSCVAAAASSPYINTDPRLLPDTSDCSDTSGYLNFAPL